MNLTKFDICPVCKEVKIKRKIGSYQICARCGSVYLSRMPSTQALAARISKWGKQNSKVERDKKIVFRDYERERIKILQQYSVEKNLLDVGCGDGRFLRYAKLHGYTVSGMDKSHTFFKFIKEQKIPAYESLAQIKRSFSIVTCFDVIEHTQDPGRLILQIKRVMKKSGYLLITTPNSKGLSALILGRHWWVFAPDDHLVLLNIGSLRLLLEKRGFKVLNIKTDTLTQWFHLNNDILNKILNKAIYLCLLSLKDILFKKGKGDNLQILAQMK